METPTTHQMTTGLPLTQPTNQPTNQSMIKNQSFHTVPPPQVQVAAADARPDLYLPAGKHEALVYVWCVDGV